MGVAQASVVEPVDDHASSVVVAVFVSGTRVSAAVVVVYTLLVVTVLADVEVALSDETSVGDVEVASAQLPER